MLLDEMLIQEKGDRTMILTRRNSKKVLPIISPHHHFDVSKTVVPHKNHRFADRIDTNPFEIYFQED